MSGDDLAVILFLLAAALAILLTLVTIHGWKHKGLLYTLWALFVFLVAAACAWPWIKELRASGIPNALSLIATNPLAYVVLALGLAVVLALTRRDQQPRPTYRPISRTDDAPKTALLPDTAPIAAQNIARPTTIGQTPSEVARKKYYLKEPHDNLAAALRESKEKNMPMFLVIYDEHHSTQSQLSHCLMWFMNFETTKKLVRDYFVSALVPSSSIDARTSPMMIR
jgi:hypothetical protein